MFRKRPTSIDGEPLPDDLLANLPQIDGDEENENEADAYPVLGAQMAPPQRGYTATHATLLQTPLAPPVATTPSYPVSFAPPSTPASNGWVAPDVRGLLSDARRQMEHAFGKELSRVEDSFGSILSDLRERLAATEADLNAARSENEQLRKAKAEYERRADALRELARSFEALSR